MMRRATVTEIDLAADCTLTVEARSDGSCTLTQHRSWRVSEHVTGGRTVAITLPAHALSELLVALIPAAHRAIRQALADAPLLTTGPDDRDSARQRDDLARHIARRLTVSS